MNMTKISTSSKASKRAVGSNQPTIEWVPASFSRKMKQPCREADHSPPMTDKIKNAYSYTSILPYAIPSLGEQGLLLILQQIIEGPCQGSAGSRRPLIPEARFQSQSSPCLRFVVKKVALEQVFLVVLRFLSFHRCCMLIHHRRYII